MEGGGLVELLPPTTGETPACTDAGGSRPGPDRLHKPRKALFGLQVVEKLGQEVCSEG